MEQRTTTHPIFLIAAIALLLFCGVGIAAFMGWLPASNSGNVAMGPPVAGEPPVQVGMADTGPPPPPAGYAPLATSGHSGGGSVGGGAPAPALAAPAAPAYDAPAARPASPARAAAAPGATCRSCGVVESVRKVSVRGQGSGLGAAGGAIVGGLLGNQIGGGHGRQLATVAGAVGGAVVGNQVEGNIKASHYYQVRVRMQDGSRRTVRSNSANWHEGERVKLVKGRLQHR